MKKRLLYILLNFIIINLSAQKKTYESDGLISLQTNLSLNNSKGYFLGGRYLPEFKSIHIKDSVTSTTFLGSANFSFSKFLNVSHSENNTSSVKPYRFWFRYIKNNFELRAGLQKIDFGSAILIRPLQWFNQIDPRDPLRLTNGVYGFLIRYYFKDNSNVWFWSLLGNNERRGLDFLNSNKNKPEFGARFQKIIPNGEIAISYHYRKTTFDQLKLINPYQINPEQRIGLDAKWDLGIGLWFEASYIERMKKIGPYSNQGLLLVGSDYTFNIGNGLNLIGEHFINFLGEKNISEESSSISATSISYPISFIGSLNAFYYRQWKNNKNTFAVNYQHNFNKITAYLIATYNPRLNEESFFENEILNTFAGPSFQLLLTYNH
ncbi:MAG: hypothetical protein CMC40_04410 [Flavobacteriaceae bacterium]|nr:hypothetical protein [Flavobacteriaceae bacterium]